MADEIVILITGDASGAVSAMQEAANSARTMASSLVGSFAGAAAAEEVLEKSGKNIVAAQIEQNEAIENVAQAVNAAAAAPANLAQSYTVLNEAQDNAAATASNLIAYQQAEATAARNLVAATDETIEARSGEAVVDERLMQLTRENVDARAALSRAEEAVSVAEKEAAGAADRVTAAREKEALATRNLTEALDQQVIAQKEAASAAVNASDAEAASIANKIKNYDATLKEAEANKLLVSSQEQVASTRSTGATTVATGQSAEAASDIERIGAAATVAQGQVLALAAANARLAETERELRAALVEGNVGAVVTSTIEHREAIAAVETEEAKATATTNELTAAIAEQQAILNEAGLSAGAYMAAAAEKQILQEQLAISTQAVTTATVQNTVATTAQATAAAANTAATAAAQTAQGAYTVTLGQGVTANAALQNAITAVTQAQAGGVVNSQLLSAALTAVQRAAQQLGYTVQQVGNQLNVLAAAQNNAAGTANAAASATSRLDNQLAMAAARMGAMDIQAGQLGYTFGTLARQGGVLGSVLSTLFVPILAVTFGEVIINIIEKFSKLEDEIRKASRALDDISDSALISAESIEFQNLKLEDQIAKLEGRPVTNRLAEAALEAKIEIDKLNKSLEDTLDKETQALENANVGLLTSLVTGEHNTSLAFNIDSDYSAIEKQATVYNETIAKKQQAINVLNGLDDKADETTKARAKKAVDDATTSASSASVELVRIAQKQYDDLEREKDKQKKTFSEPFGPNKPININPDEVKAKNKEIDESYAKEETHLLDVLNLVTQLNRQIKATEVKGDLGSDVAADENQKDIAVQLEKQLNFQKQLADIRSTSEIERSKVGVKEESIEYSSTKEQQAVDATYAKDRQILLSEAETNKDIEDIHQVSLEKIALLDAKYEEDKKTRIARTAAAIVEENRKLEEEQTKLSTPKFLEEIGSKPKDRLLETTVNAEDRKAAEERFRVIELEITEIQRKRSLSLSSHEEEQRALSAELEKIKERAAFEQSIVQNKIDTVRSRMETDVGLPKGTQTEYAANMKELRDLTEQLSALQRQYNAEIGKTADSLLKLDLSFATFFEKMKNSTLSFTDTFKTSMQAALDQLNNGFADSVGQWIKNGGDFGTMMANVGVNMLTSLTETFIKLGEKQLETHLATLIGIKRLDETVGSTGKTEKELKKIGYSDADIAALKASATPQIVATNTNTVALNANTAALQAKALPAGLPGTPQETTPTVTPAASSAELEKLFPEHYGLAGQGGQDQSSIFSLYSSQEKLADSITKYEAGPSPTAGTAAVRNFNPGNLKFAGQTGATEEAGTGFAQFQNEAAGRAALIKQLELIKQRTPAITPEAFTARYSPNEAPGNGPGTSEAYARFLRQRADVTTPPFISPGTTANSLERTIPGQATGGQVLSSVTTITAPAANTINAPLAKEGVLGGGGTTAPVQTGPGLATGGQVPGQISSQAQLASVQAANAQKQVLYAQDVTAYRAAELQKTSITTASEAQQSAQVTAQQIQQTSQIVTQKTAQTTATVAANATQVTSAATAGAATVAIDKASTSASKLDHAKSAAVKAYDAMAAIPIIGPALGAAAAAATFAFLVAFAEGGHVQGAGTGTSDSIPARVSHGEFIVRASEVSKPGMLQHLSSINQGGFLSAPGLNEEKHAQGGLILSFAHGGEVSDKENNIHFAKGGPVFAFAQGGSVLGKDNNSTVHNNIEASKTLPGFSTGGKILSSIFPIYGLEQAIQHHSLANIGPLSPLGAVKSFKDAWTKGTHSWANPLTYLIARERKSAITTNAVKAYTEGAQQEGDKHATGGLILGYAVGGKVQAPKLASGVSTKEAMQHAIQNTSILHSAETFKLGAEKFDGGGKVHGTGTGTSDSIPARVSHGEFIVRANEVAKPGMLEHLNTINSGTIPTIDHAGGGLVEPTLAFSHGGIALPSISMSGVSTEGRALSFAKGGLVPGGSTVTSVRSFAQGGAVSTENQTTSGPVTHNNMRFQFAPTVQGNFDVSKHGEEMFGFMQSKLRRSGLDI